jgi:hypothetical protein
MTHGGWAVVATVVVWTNGLAGRGEAQESRPTLPWAMHKIDNVMYNHNSLGPGDVNGDGCMDYAVMHEGPGKYTFILHPGKGGDVRAPWKKVIVGKGGNPENSAFGDFDGDGFLDIVGVGGEGAGIKIFWGPEPSRVTDPAAWTDGGTIPGTPNRGHILSVQSQDVNQDGATDILAGGRALGTHSTANVEGKKTAGIIWIEAPAAKEDRRNLSKWVIHDIDSSNKGGFAFVHNDVNMDGHLDIINCNADWNTRKSETEVVWYENPGHGSLEQKKEWRRHVIYQGGDFYSKAQVAIGDLDGDGLIDFCIPTETQIFFFRKTGVNPVSWERIIIPKDKKTQWLQRPLAMADLDGDGKMDLVGMLIYGKGLNPPPDKASVYWMSYSGTKPTADNWTTHVIKWGDGGTAGGWRGEKWDNIRFGDIDGDGDLDIVGNCEEHHDAQKKTIIGVVWFENPTISKRSTTRSK